MIIALKKRELKSLKQTMKKLRTATLTRKTKENVTLILTSWLSDCAESDFMNVYRQAVTWANEEQTEDRFRKLTPVLILRSEQAGFLNDDDRRNAVIIPYQSY